MNSEVVVCLHHVFYGFMVGLELKSSWYWKWSGLAPLERGVTYLSLSSYGQLKG